MNTTQTMGSPSVLPTLGAARWYYYSGWQPIPLHPRQKRPVDNGWPARDFGAEGLEKHFQGYTNVGLKCGSPSGGLVDVDIDDEHAIRIADVFLPPTKMRHGRAGNPNSHRWYLLSGEPGNTQQFRDVDNTMLIELRATGGQTAVPPSIHPDGDKLVWDEFSGPAPSELGPLSVAVTKIAVAALIARHWPQEGGRNDASMALAGMLLRGGMTDDGAEQFVSAVAVAALDEEADARVLNVAGTRKKLDAGQSVTGFTRLSDLIGADVAALASKWLQECGALKISPEWESPVFFSEQKTPKIPASLLPGVLGTFAAALAAEAEVPEALPVMTVLGTVATALAKRVVVCPHPTWTEPVNVYTAVALPPGSNKSLILKRCTDPLRFWEGGERMRLDPLITAALSMRKSEESHIQYLRVRSAREKDPVARNNLFQQIQQLDATLTKVPAMPQLFASDLTPEALATKVDEQGGRFAIISDEGGITETMSGLYTGGAANVDILLKGHDGGDARIARRGSPELIMNPYLTLVLTIQPRILQNMADRRAFQGNGLLERFLFVLPESTLGFRTHRGASVAPSVEQNYADLVIRLLSIPPNTINGIESPYRLALSAAAHSLWSGFRDEVEVMLRPAGVLREISGWGGKLPGTVLRMAALMHVADKGVQALQIDDTTMNSAIIMARLLMRHALAARQLMGADQATEDAKAVFEWLKSARRERFTRTECVEANRGRVATTKRMDALLGVLRDHNIVRETETVRTGGRGRPAHEYEVNPLIYAH